MFLHWRWLGHIYPNAEKAETVLTILATQDLRGGCLELELSLNKIFRHCEERSGVAIHKVKLDPVDRRKTLAMTEEGL